MNVDFVEVRITTRGGTQKALFSSSAGAWPVLSLRFDLAIDEGCGDLEMVVASDKVNGTIQVGYLIEVSATYSGTSTKYYTGVITSTPKPTSKSRAWRYEAKGLWYELEQQRVVKYYEGKDVDDAVKDILADIDTPITAISTGTSEVSVASPYTVADIESEYESAAELIAQLAMLQGDIQYGVDQNRKLYFKDITTSYMAHYVVGTHIAQIDVSENTDSMVNEIYAQSKEVVGGGCLTFLRSDSTSMSTYGHRTRLVSVRNTRSGNDVIRYADNMIAKYKDPATRVVADFPAFSGFIFPRGRVRVIDSNGTVYSLPIQRVIYELDPTFGLKGSMEVGDLPGPKIEETMREIIRRIERNTNGVVSIVRQEHTRGEEFSQWMIIHAKKAGFLNTFNDTCSDTKSMNMRRSGHVNHRGIYYMGPMEFASSRLISNVIPTGKVVDTVRVYLNTDLYGRIDFSSDDELQFFFQGLPGASPHGEGAIDDWRASESDDPISPMVGAGLEQYQNGDLRMFYRCDHYDIPDGQTAWYFRSLPFKIRMTYKCFGAPTVAQNCFFYYWDTDPPGFSTKDFAEAEIDATGANILVKFKKSIYLSNALVYTTSTLETLTIFSSFPRDGSQLGIEMSAAAGANKVSVYSVDDNGDFDTLEDETATYDLGSLEGNIRRFGFSRFCDASTIQARIGWVELEDPAASRALKVKVSRDGGVTWTAEQSATQGNGYLDFDVSGQPNGTSLMVRFYLVHPKRLYGWGVAF